MKKFIITTLMSFLLLLSALGFAENLPVEKDPMEHYEMQEVGMTLMHGGENSGAFYQIITDNGVAGLYEGEGAKGWLTFLKPGDAIVDMYMPIEGKMYVSRYHYNIVPKGTFEQECIDVFNYVNHTRNEHGLKLLEFSAELNAVCAVRAKELAVKYSHTRPDGSFFVSALTNRGNCLSENICFTIKPASETELPEYFNAWDSWNKNQESRTNMLNPAVREMGMSFYFDPATQKRYWVQLFRGDGSGISPYNYSSSASGISSVSNTATASDNVSAESSRGVEAFPEEVLQLVNKERAKVGARPLRLSQDLQDAAAIRAEEITRHFAHERPDGSSCFTLLRNRNRTLGENIAAGNATPEEVVDQWMHSPGHRANMLNKDFKELGVGYCRKEGTEYTHYWIQMFRG